MEGSKGKDEKSFESIWAERFADAETAPSDHVWKGISGELANQQVGSYKKRVVYYKWAAAASLFIALTLGVLYYLNTPSQTTESLTADADASSPEVLKSTESTSPETLKDDKILELEVDRLAATERQNSNKTKSLESTNTRADYVAVVQTPEHTTNKSNSNGQSSVNSISVVDESLALEEQSQSEGNLGDFESNNSLIIAHQSAKIIQADELVNKISPPDRIYAVPIYANASEDQEEDDGQVLWAGVNLGSGSFDPNYGPPTGSLDEASFASEDFTPALDANTAGLPLREESNSGPSLAVGIDLGTSIGKRWVLQTGLNYGRYRVNTNTNLVFSSDNQAAVPLSFQNREALFSEDEVTISNENLDIDNNFQLLSVPLKAGFLLIDKKFNVLLNAGFATDWYMGNSLNSTGDEFARYDIAPGSESPYRRIHISGLTGVQLGYQIQENYYLSIEPNYRKSITDFAKTGNSFSSRPSRIGLLVGFRYLFR